MVTLHKNLPQVFTNHINTSSHSDIEKSLLKSKKLEKRFSEYTGICALDVILGLLDIILYCNVLAEYEQAVLVEQEMKHVSI
jgi:hypothetical protein